MTHLRFTPLLFVCLLALVPDIAHAEADCQSDSPARPVPQFTPEAPGVSLWPLDGQSGEPRIRPAGVPLGTTRDQLTALPEERDSTQYLTQTAPGVLSGHELFQDVAVPGSRDEDATPSEWLIAVYNAGIQVWDISVPGDPKISQRRDGWPAPFGLDEWAHFVVFGEDDTFVLSVDAIEVGELIYIGVAAEFGVGFSAWTFDPSTKTLEQVYQGIDDDTRDVSVVEAPNGSVYAFTADADGVRIYDLSTAAINGLCVEESDDICGVRRGLVGDLPKAQHVSAAVLDGGIYVAASDGITVNSLLSLELWEVGDPENPATEPEGTAVRRYTAGEGHYYSPQLFTYQGAHYLALVDKSGGLNTPGEMRIHELGDCLSGCTELPFAVASESLKLSLAGVHFLDVSYSEGSPFLHYGMETTGLFGAGFERLWELEQLPQGFAPDTLPELTDGGGTYLDPCEGTEVDYFGDYYINNDYGLRHYNPRHGVFSGAYLYRAAESVLDVHVRAVPACGDGVVQGQEECDDGNTNNFDACTNMCTQARCGDGVVQPGESCDDGNEIPDDACTNNCTEPTCGDGIVQAGEACDDPDDPNCVDCALVGEDTTATTGDPPDSSTSGESTAMNDSESASGTGDGGHNEGEGCGCSQAGDRGLGALLLFALCGVVRRRLPLAIARNP